MNIKEFLKDNIVILDGGMGTFLQSAGLAPGERPERWNLSNPDVVQGIHEMYFAAGSDAVITNTFGACGLRFEEEELKDIVRASIRNARKAAEKYEKDGPKFVGLDIGPCGKLLKPFGDLDFEDCVESFAKQVRAMAEEPADFIFIETMSDCYETKAAVLAAKENSDLPIFASNAYGENGRLMTGADPGAMSAMLEGLGVAAMGVNCSLGPDLLKPVVLDYLTRASIPVIMKPNAGLPSIQDGKTVYSIGPEEFAEIMEEMVKAGVRLAGGCCGTTPEYIAAMARRIKGYKPAPIQPKNETVISSYSHSLVFGADPVLIGERINPTGKKRLKQAVLDGDMAYILREAAGQEDAGVHALDVNVGVPGTDEPKNLAAAVCELQAAVDLPLQIDTSNPKAMEAALRLYNGKALINSVNGTRESLDAVLPLAAKYGGVLIALTLDDDGIPMDVDGRVKIAKKIIAEAAKYGISKKDLVFDTLAMPVSASGEAARVTLQSLERITNELGCRTSLGISNVSFGLPHRADINAGFFAAALGKGLSAAIINPYSDEMMRAYHVHRVLAGLDENCTGYIEYANTHEPAPAAVSNPKAAAPAATPQGSASPADPAKQVVSLLQDAIARGFRDQAASEAKACLKEMEPLDLINFEIIPALNTVGDGFEKGKIYLPQLLMSAEAASGAFEVVKAAMEGLPKGAKKCEVVVATVKGDIHDIGKNIVKLLLDSYGFQVTDLGKDVAPEEILEAVQRLHAPACGLSALMTTTVPAMEETVALLHREAPYCRVITGGAVLTRDYAEGIGSDCYAKDAMDTVRFAEGLC